MKCLVFYFFNYFWLPVHFWRILFFCYHITSKHKLRVSVIRENTNSWFVLLLGILLYSINCWDSYDENSGYIFLCPSLSLVSIHPINKSLVRDQDLPANSLVVNAASMDELKHLRFTHAQYISSFQYSYSKLIRLLLIHIISYLWLFIKQYC